MTRKTPLTLSSHQFKEVYADLGVDLDQLGCVMLDLEPLRHEDVFSDETGLSPYDLYTSPLAGPKVILNGEFVRRIPGSRSHLDGFVAGRKSHVTLLYGLLGQIGRWGTDHFSNDYYPTDLSADHVDQVLDTWVMPTRVVVDQLAAFRSPYPEGDPDHDAYSCIVAKVSPSMNPAILEAHQRLSFLPHINTHPEYTPHVTIAYVKRDAEDRWLGQLDHLLMTKQLDLTTIGLDYGDTLGGTR
jgi:hypothetical protein